METNLTRIARWIQNDRDAEGRLADSTVTPTTGTERVVATTAIVVAENLIAIFIKSVNPVHRKDVKVETVMDDPSRLRTISVVRSMGESYAMLHLMPGHAVLRKGKY
jgi:hypothetical protein